MLKAKQRHYFAKTKHEMVSIGAPYYSTDRYKNTNLSSSNKLSLQASLAPGEVRVPVRL